MWRERLKERDSVGVAEVDGLYSLEWMDATRAVIVGHKRRLGWATTFTVRLQYETYSGGVLERLKMS